MLARDAAPVVLPAVSVVRLAALAPADAAFLAVPLDVAAARDAVSLAPPATREAPSTAPLFTLSATFSTWPTAELAMMAGRFFQSARPPYAAAAPAAAAAPILSSSPLRLCVLLAICFSSGRDRGDIALPLPAPRDHHWLP